jgi:hypothetical protein
MNIYCERRGAHEGAVWPLHPAYDIIWSDGLLKEGEGLYRAWIYIVSDVGQEGAVWPLYATRI